MYIWSEDGARDRAVKQEQWHKHNIAYCLTKAQKCQAFKLHQIDPYSDEPG